MRILLLCYISVFLACVGSKSVRHYVTTLEYPASVPVFIRLTGLDSSLNYEVKVSGKSGILQYVEGEVWVFKTESILPANTTLDVQRTRKKESVRLIVQNLGSHLSVNLDEREILQYAVEMRFPADTLPDYYQRSGFMDPVKTTSGAVITAGFPRGHVHQHGIFHAWTRSIVKDSMVDFWNQQAELGTVRHKKIRSIENGPVFSSFSVDLEYVSYMPDTMVVSQENWMVRIFPLEADYLIDWTLHHVVTGIDSLVLPQYHYGGAAFRGAELWNVEQGAYDSLVYFRTSEGKDQTDGNHSQPAWVVMYGETVQGLAGAAMIQHPGNFRYPQSVRIHPTMPYYCFAPMVTGPFTLARGQVYQARYGLLVFDGMPDIGRIEQFQAVYGKM